MRRTVVGGAGRCGVGGRCSGGKLGEIVVGWSDLGTVRFEGREGGHLCF